jgi:hypothetical protein
VEPCLRGKDGDVTLSSCVFISDDDRTERPQRVLRKYINECMEFRVLCLSPFKSLLLRYKTTL